MTISVITKPARWLATFMVIIALAISIAPPKEAVDAFSAFLGDTIELKTAFAPISALVQSGGVILVAAFTICLFALSGFGRPDLAVHFARLNQWLCPPLLVVATSRMAMNGTLSEFSFVGILLFSPLYSLSLRDLLVGMNFIKPKRSYLLVSTLVLATAVISAAVIHALR